MHTPPRTAPQPFAQVFPSSQEGSQYALDDLCDSAGALVAGDGFVIYAGRIHPRSPDPCHSRRVDQGDPGSPADMKRE